MVQCVYVYAVCACMRAYVRGVRGWGKLVARLEVRGRGLMSLDEGIEEEN